MMIRVIFKSEAAAREYARNEHGHVYQQADGTYLVLVLDD